MPRVTKPRDYISPSDLSFLWGECKRCMWLKYNKGLSRPGFMPLVGPMASFQEATYRNAPTSVIHKDMTCLLYTSPSPRDRQKSRMPSSA